MEEENVQIIELRQVPIIEERLRAVKEQIEERTRIASELVCTEETVKEVKRVRADLTKQFNQLEEQRKMVKQQILEPYNQFDALYKECCTEPFKRADGILKGKIDEVESGVKAEKEQKARTYFNELCQSADIDWLTWERTGIKAGMSTTLSRLKAQSMEAVDKVKKDISLIDTMDDRDEILVEYKQSLDVGIAVARVNERKAALKAQAAKEAEWRAREAEKAARAQEVQAAAKKQRQIEAASAPVKVDAEPKQGGGPTPREKVYRVRFDAYGTLEQLKKLKHFLESEDIRYESAT